MRPVFAPGLGRQGASGGQVRSGTFSNEIPIRFSAAEREKRKIECAQETCQRDLHFKRIILFGILFEFL